MQEYQKLPKKSNRTATIKNTHFLNDRIAQIEDLLKIDLIPCPEKKPRNIPLGLQNSRGTTSRKSHKSLAINLQKLHKHTRHFENRKHEKQKLEYAKVAKTQAMKTAEKQITEQLNESKQKDKESSLDTREVVSHDFVEKKMKVGKKFKGNAMKEFILQTLSKGKAEGICLVIHKGTAQCSYSPINKNKSEAQKPQKEQYPLVLVQDGNLVQRRKKQNQSILGGNKGKINRSLSSKSTAVNISVNKKLVKMARQYQNKGKKIEANHSIAEIIQQKIQANQDEKSEANDEIQEQIIVSNNYSLIKQKEKDLDS